MMVSTLVQQRFGAAAADYAASAVHARGESLARLVTLVSPRAEWRVLDVATGAGHTALAFAPHVAHVVASDITEEMLAQATRLASDKGLANVETAHADAGALPFADQCFDLVTCRLAAHHFPDPAQFVREAWRVLKPGGTFALVDNIGPDEESLSGATDAELREAGKIYNAYEALRDPSHARCLGFAEWLGLMQDAGFVDLRAERMDQDIAFGPWTARMRCTPETVRRLEAMLGEEALRTYLGPRVTEDGPTFTLQEAIIVALKPGRA
ncbi:MAG TPA: methyltransferase domain-containing protein [Hyphomicrobium sp.]|jgi:SAM-dependent methyltransferase